MNTMIKRTFKSSGVQFNVVNELDTPVKNKLLKVVNEYMMSKDFSKVQAILGFIAEGACGKVYDLGDGLILKINIFGWRSQTPDGDILRDLQGVPCIPKLYWYSEDNRFIVVQKINGLTTRKFNQEPFKLPKAWVREEHDQLMETVYKACLERGWYVNDIHGGNCMIDLEGNFWIVDVGLFDKDMSGWNVIGDLRFEGVRIQQGLNKLQEKQSLGVAV
ncbi:hypothetical protein HV417_02070 [Bacillus sporothermodurans]|uniref:hypothetical protein n=1 Tax=Heyndrickxia sporothermodurans TaxID=46224 RepID=UPI00192C2BF2|nr:hypothetical protein [Heyndrickxia sporothermodurans]MBL5872349.1 hypothetical protein [Heyndrickxia sporothermodurans]